MPTCARQNQFRFQLYTFHKWIKRHGLQDGDAWIDKILLKAITQNHWSTVAWKMRSEPILNYETMSSIHGKLRKIAKSSALNRRMDQYLFVCLVFNGTSTQDRSICPNRGRVKPTQLAKDGQQDTMHNSQYVTQCNTQLDGQCCLVRGPHAPH